MRRAGPFYSCGATVVGSTAATGLATTTPIQHREALLTEERGETMGSESGIAACTTNSDSTSSVEDASSSSSAAG